MNPYSMLGIALAPVAAILFRTFVLKPTRRKAQAGMKDGWLKRALLFKVWNS